MFNFKEEDIKTVKFELNESKITPIQKQTLDRIVKILAVKTEFAIKISPSFLEKNKNSKIIVSGGQGENEDISEAQCMKET